MYVCPTLSTSIFHRLSSTYFSKIYVCLSVSVCLSHFVSLSVCLSVCLSLSLILSILSISFSFSLSVCLSLNLFLSVSLSVCLSLSACLSLSVSLFFACPPPPSTLCFLPSLPPSFPVFNSIDYTTPIPSIQAIGLRINPLFFMFPATISSSFAFMLPVATPPNAIVFSHGDIQVLDMVGCTEGVMDIVGCMEGVFSWGHTSHRHSRLYRRCSHMRT